MSFSAAFYLSAVNGIDELRDFPKSYHNIKGLNKFLPLQQNLYGELLSGLHRIRDNSTLRDLLCRFSAAVAPAIFI